MLQNATHLRKSAPSPPYISDEHVSCTAPAMENASLQILFKWPTPAIVFGHATKPSRFARFWQGAQCPAPATRNDASTSKSGAYMCCFVDFDFEMCFATFLPFRTPGSCFFGDFLFLIFFLLLFSSLLWLFPSLLFICPYCRKFDF